MSDTGARSPGDIVRQFRVETGIYHQGNRLHDDRVTVRRRAYRQLGADVAGSTGTVVHQHLLPHILGHFLREKSRHDIHASAGSKGDNHAHRFSGVRLSAGLQC